MTDQTNETDEPLASGLDDWWQHSTSGAGAVDKEKAAVDAADFQQARAYRYLASGGTDQIGGFGSTQRVRRADDELAARTARGTVWR